MTTKLDRPLRRAITIDREPWVVTITPTGLKLTRKGRRIGVELDWKGLASGEAALAAALNASVRPRSRPSRSSEPRGSRSAPRPRRTSQESRR
jgi:hypothetical protein